MITNKLERPEGVADLLRSPDLAVHVPVERVPAILAQIASLQAMLLARLLSAKSPEPPPVGPDRLLTATDAAHSLGVSPRWLYRHAPRLPFTRRLSRKVLRFSEVGLRRYLAGPRG